MISTVECLLYSKSEKNPAENISVKTNFSFFRIPNNVFHVAKSILILSTISQIIPTIVFQTKFLIIVF